MNALSFYLLDANVFIEAAQRYYAFDLVPRFWTRLEELAEAGRIGSVDRVQDELEKLRDRVSEWAATNFADGFFPTDERDVLEEYRSVMAWVNGQTQFMDAAKHKFADGADGWLIAYAKANAHVIVTHEQPAPEAKKAVKIPDVCKAFRIRYVDTFQMLRELGIRLT